MLVLAGCDPLPPTSETPTSSPTATSTPSATPVAPTDTVTPTPPIMAPEEPEDLTRKIVIGSDHLFIRNSNDETIKKYSYKDTPEELVAAIDEIYDVERTSEYSGEAMCWWHMTTYDWGNFKLSFQTEDMSTTEFYIVQGEIDPTSTVPVESLNGAALGESYDDYLPNVIGNPSNSYENRDWILDEQTDEFTASDGPEGLEGNAELNLNAYGVIVNAEDGVITNITAPQYLFQDC